MMMPQLDPISLIALAAVTLIGLPHGAMDAAVALALGYGRNFGKMAVFVLAYVVLAAVVVGFWIVAPVLALALFLLISLVHFGLGDTEAQNPIHKYVQMIAHGSVVTVAIPFWHKQEVSTVFEMISGPHDWLWPLMDGAAVICVLAGIAYAVLALGQPGLRRGFAEWLSLMAIVAVLPPLVGFAVYFTLVHTPRHVLRISYALKARDLPVWGMTAGFTGATWATAAVAWLLLAGRIGVDAASLQIVFIGLAALTVPHMILIDGVFRPGLRSA